MVHLNWIITATKQPLRSGRCYPVFPSRSSWMVNTSWSRRTRSSAVRKWLPTHYPSWSHCNANFWIRLRTRAVAPSSVSQLFSPLPIALTSRSFYSFSFNYTNAMNHVTVTYVLLLILGWTQLCSVWLPERTTCPLKATWNKSADWIITLCIPISIQ